MNDKALRFGRVLLLTGSAVALFSPSSAAADLWRWKDAQGNVNITQDSGSIPPEFRSKAEVISNEKEPRSGAVAPDRSPATSGAEPEARPPTAEAESGDGSGQNRLATDRAYWEQRAKELRDKIQEEEVKITELKSERGRATQPYAHTLREMRTGIAEAQKKIDSLKKQLAVDLPAEAAKAGANPAWVK